MTWSSATPAARSGRPPGLTTSSFALLESFEGQASRSLLSQDDWSRLFDFISHAFRQASSCSGEDLHFWLTSVRRWPDEFAGDISHFYERGTALLRHAAFHADDS